MPLFQITRHNSLGKCPASRSVVSLPLAPTSYDVNDDDGPLATLTPTDGAVTTSAPDSLIESLSAWPDTDELSDRFYQRAQAAAQAVKVPGDDFSRVTGKTRGALLVQWAIWRSFNCKPPSALLESIGDLPANLLIEPGSDYRALVAAEESKVQAVKAAARARVKPTDPIETRKLAGRYVFQARSGVVLPPEIEWAPTYTHALSGDKSFPLPEIPGMGWTQRVGNRDWVVLGPGDEWTAPASIYNLPVPVLDDRWWHKRQAWAEQYHQAANTPQRGARPAPSLEYAALGEKWIKEHGPALLNPPSFLRALTCQVLINGYLLPLEWTVEALWAEMRRQHAANVTRIEWNPKTQAPNVWRSDVGTGPITTPPEHPHNGWNEPNIAELCTTFYVSTSPCHMPYGAMVPPGWVEATADRIKRLVAPWLGKILASKPAELSPMELAVELAGKAGVKEQDPQLGRAIAATLTEQGYTKVREGSGDRKMIYVPAAPPGGLTEAQIKARNMEYLIDHGGQAPPGGFPS